MNICGNDILVKGKIIRVGMLAAEGFDYIDNPHAVLDALKQERSGIDIFSFIQPLADASPKYGYAMEWDNMASMEITTFDDWMTNRIGFKARNKVRKAGKKGVTIQEMPFTEELVKGISEVYNESPLRQGKKFWHYGKTLEQVRKVNETFLDRSVFVGATFEGKLIGFIKLVATEDGRQAGLMQILSMMQHRDKATTNALIADAVRVCAERKITHLWYAKFSYGTKQKDSLAEFKENNGFQKVEIPRYYIPLTAAGRFALKYGLHRTIADRVPESLASRYRRARSLWYAKRYPGFEGA